MTIAIFSPPVESAEERPAPVPRLHHKAPDQHPAVELSLAWLSLLLSPVVWLYSWYRGHSTVIKKAIALVASAFVFGTVFGLWLAGVR